MLFLGRFSGVLQHLSGLGVRFLHHALALGLGVVPGFFQNPGRLPVSVLQRFLVPPFQLCALFLLLSGIGQRTFDQGFSLLHNGCHRLNEKFFQQNIEDDQVDNGPYKIHINTEHRFFAAFPLL